ncbi:hypothetical protein OV079_33210 [Nannocystis pusilla]|uniref:Uncharacterized protein n=1 Tax=Nannocystis pusilla TaxID=889268 RepID=A0A9X3EU87_9BACT|nr:hypothetical protein [Nannocystis pusilla]MCY1010343.1 hypothetical protein [Nannocystis pusilla]
MPKGSDGELDPQAVAGEGRAVEGPAGAVGGGLVGEGDVGDDELAAGDQADVVDDAELGPGFAQRFGEAEGGKPPT